jgi:hypothetical protein
MGWRSRWARILEHSASQSAASLLKPVNCSGRQLERGADMLGQIGGHGGRIVVRQIAPLIQAEDPHGMVADVRGSQPVGEHGVGADRGLASDQAELRRRLGDDGGEDQIRRPAGSALHDHLRSGDS